MHISHFATACLLGLPALAVGRPVLVDTPPRSSSSLSYIIKATGNNSTLFTFVDRTGNKHIDINKHENTDQSASHRDSDSVGPKIPFTDKQVNISQHKDTDQSASHRRDSDLVGPKIVLAMDQLVKREDKAIESDSASHSDVTQSEATVGAQALDSEHEHQKGKVDEDKVVAAVAAGTVPVLTVAGALRAAHHKSKGSLKKTKDAYKLLDREHDTFKTVRAKQARERKEQAHELRAKSKEQAKELRAKTKEIKMQKADLARDEYFEDVTKAEQQDKAAMQPSRVSSDDDAVPNGSKSVDFGDQQIHHYDKNSPPSDLQSSTTETKGLGSDKKAKKALAKIQKHAKAEASIQVQEEAHGRRKGFGRGRGHT